MTLVASYARCAITREHELRHCSHDNTSVALGRCICRCPHEESVTHDACTALCPWTRLLLRGRLTTAYTDTSPINGLPLRPHFEAWVSILRVAGYSTSTRITRSTCARSAITRVRPTEHSVFSLEAVSLLVLVLSTTIDDDAASRLPDIQRIGLPILSLTVEGPDACFALRPIPFRVSCSSLRVYPNTPTRRGGRRCIRHAVSTLWTWSGFPVCRFVECWILRWASRTRCWTRARLPLLSTLT